MWIGRRYELSWHNWDDSQLNFDATFHLTAVCGVTTIFAQGCHSLSLLLQQRALPLKHSPSCMAEMLQVGPKIQAEAHMNITHVSLALSLPL